MSVEITVPAAGESVSSGVLATWLKGDGEAVSEGEELFELETDKATLAVPSPASGKLKQKAKEGDEVTVGSVVGLIVSEESAAIDTATAATVNGTGGAASVPALSPAVRRIVDENNLDPASIEGTGKGGRITKEDALRTVEARSVGESVRPSSSKEESTIARAPSAMPSPVPRKQTDNVKVNGRQERIPLSTIRRRIAERLVQGKLEAAHLTTFNEIDMSNVIALRSRYRDAFQSKHGVKLGFMSFFVKAGCEALRELPTINAYLEGGDIVYNNFYDIGVAVSSDRGLVVPVLRDADGMSFSEIERQIADKAKRVREKKMTLDELTGGTFTITNGGVFGSLLSTPIPNFPQSAILGMHTIQNRPMAVDEQIVIRPMMYVALTYDHRIVDGRGAVTFLVRIKEYIENPERLLLEV